MPPIVTVIGAGLAGCEAALVLASRGVQVELHEMRPGRMTPAHTTGLPAELVCSNSLKSRIMPSASALLKEELALLGSPLLRTAQQSCVPAGSALAVDRIGFSSRIAGQLSGHPRIRLIPGEVALPPRHGAACIIATGPLTSEALTEWLVGRFTSASLFFYDAIAPIVSRESVDMSVAFYASRWDKSSADYLNCPFTEEEYRRFHAELTAADQSVRRDFEDERFFEACLPLEVIASRGDRALAFGPLKPVGLFDPRTGRRPFAVCQLRKETVSGDALGMVAFQTRLTIPEQQRVFQLIPGLERAQFLRYGSIHRNTYLDSPRLLTPRLNFRDDERLFLAGQICGNEGYVESIATGHLAALFVEAMVAGRPLPPAPFSTALGALLAHVTGSTQPVFSPSQFHFGLLPPSLHHSKKIGKEQKRALLCARALEDLKAWIERDLGAATV